MVNAVNVIRVCHGEGVEQDRFLAIPDTMKPADAAVLVDGICRDKLADGAGHVVWEDLVGAVAGLGLVPVHICGSTAEWL